MSKNRLTAGLRCFAILAALVLAAMPNANAQKKGLLGALLGAGAGAAAGASNKEGPKVYSESHLRPEALKACLISANRIDGRDAEIDVMGKKMEKGESEIAKQKATLERDGKREFSEQKDVDRYNAAVRAHKASVASYNKLVGQYNAAIDAGKPERAAFSKDCNGKRYYSSDLESIRGQLPFDPAKAVGKS